MAPGPQPFAPSPATAIRRPARGDPYMDYRTLDVARVQSYLRHLASVTYGGTRVQGFTAFFHATDDMRHLNYAIPDAEWDRTADRSFLPMRREFEARSRLPRLEFIEEFAPSLPGALRVVGFYEEYRGPVMVCTPNSLSGAPDVPGLAVERVDGADDSALAEFALTQRRGFGADPSWAPTESDIAYSRAAPVAGAALVARLGAQTRWGYDRDDITRAADTSVAGTRLAHQIEHADREDGRERDREREAIRGCGGRPWRERQLQHLGGRQLTDFLLGHLLDGRVEHHALAAQEAAHDARDQQRGNHAHESGADEPSQHGTILQ